MDKNLLEIASFVLGVPVNSLGSSTSASTCAGWNRNRLLTIVSQCESDFGIDKFSQREIEQIETLGDLERMLNQKIAFKASGNSKIKNRPLTEHEVVKMVAETLLIDPSTISPATRKEKIPEWDSMGVITILAMLEDEFHIDMSVEEAAALNGMPDFLELLRKNNKII